jgi:3-methyladenine DNA glycosylase/8-oxoguanine DNA glycosylase
VLRAVAASVERIDRLADAPSSDAAKALLAIPGVGPWTVAKTLAVSHGDADQVEVGDFHLKHMVVHHLTGRSRGSDEEMLELLEPFRPHRGRVTRLLHTLGHEPSFGPRLAPKDITRI